MDAPSAAAVPSSPDRPSATFTRRKPSSKMPSSSSPELSNGTSSSSTTTTTSRQGQGNQQRNNPYYPTPTEIIALALYPTLLLFGTLFSLLNPSVRSSPYDFISQSHVQDSGAVPSYFARKDNLFNVLFVKRAWFWITVSFFGFLFSHPGYNGVRGGSGSGSGVVRKVRAVVRWGLVTLWWVFVTQWFFGPAIVDRGFRVTGGKCQEAQGRVNAQVKADSMPGPVGGQGGDGGGAEIAGLKEFVTAAACKAAGGKWQGGHDISGHVFLLVLGSAFLVQEVGWVVAKHYWRRGGVKDERTVVMHDGAVKSAGTDLPRETTTGEEKRWDDYSPEMDGQREAREVVTTGGGLWDALGHGGKAVLGVVGLSAWMLLMTAIYFHTWFEKLTGLLVALMGLYFTYIVPRFIPALRGIVGLPGL